MASLVGKSAVASCVESRYGLAREKKADGESGQRLDAERDVPVAAATAQEDIGVYECKLSFPCSASSERVK